MYVGQWVKVWKSATWGSCISMDFKISINIVITQSLILNLIHCIIYPLLPPCCVLIHEFGGNAIRFSCDTQMH